MPDLYQAGVVTRPVSELLPGDRVDLEADSVADPVGHGGGESPAAYQCDFQTVEAAERETGDCIAVYFENGPAVGFPVDHRVEVDGEQGTDGRFLVRAWDDRGPVPGRPFDGVMRFPFDVFGADLEPLGRVQLTWRESEHHRIPQLSLAGRAELKKSKES